MSERRIALLQRAGIVAQPALARRLAKSGHDLVVHAPRDGQVEELLALGVEVEVIEADELGPDKDFTAPGCQLLVDRALARFGRIDAAALAPSRGPEGTHPIKGYLLDVPDGHIGIMNGYIDTTAHILRAVIPAIRANGKERGGQILVYTSDAGARPEANWSLYGAARAGQHFLVRAVALEHAADGICINALGSKNAITANFPFAPPDAATDSEVTLGPWAEPLLAETPLGRLGTMEELAAFAAVLLDGSNRFQTAQYFSFSGGWSEA